MVIIFGKNTLDLIKMVIIFRKFPLDIRKAGYRSLNDKFVMYEISKSNNEYKIKEAVIKKLSLTINFGLK